MAPQLRQQTRRGARTALVRDTCITGEISANNIGAGTWPQVRARGVAFAVAWLATAEFVLGLIQGHTRRKPKNGKKHEMSAAN